MITCTNCSVQSPEGTKFCPNCGYDLVAQQAAAAAAQPPTPPAPSQPPAPPAPPQSADVPPVAPPPATQPPPVAAPPPVEQTPAAPPPPAVTAATPAATTPAPAVGDTGGYGTDTGAYAPPAAPSGGGGIGMSGKIAAAVGAVVILGGVFAGVKLLTGNDQPAQAAATTDSSGEQPEPAASPTTDTGTTVPEEVPTPTPTPAPESGSLTDFIEDPVGTWELADLAESPDIAQAWGATDALSALYADANGVQVGFTIAAYTSTEEAYATVPVLANSLLAGEPTSLPIASGPLAADFAQQGGGGGRNQFQVFDQGDITGQDGTVLGQYVLLEGPVELIFWSNGPYIRAAESIPGAALDFFANSSF